MRTIHQTLILLSLLATFVSCEQIDLSALEDISSRPSSTVRLLEHFQLRQE